MSKKTSSSSSRESVKKDRKGKQSKSSISLTSLQEPLVAIDDEASKKSSVLAFAVLSKEDSEEIITMSCEEMERKFQDIFQLNPTTQLKDAAILDHFVSAAHWASQQGFSAQQLSGFFTVIHTLLNKVKDEHLCMVDVLKEYKKMLVGIEAELSSEIESGGMEFFTVKQAQAITRYLQNSLFQHFHLFEFMFSKSQWKEIVGSDLSVEVPPPADAPFPPPLDEGISETVYNDFLSIRTPCITESTESTGEAGGDAKPQTPIQVELPPEVEDIFTKLTPEDVRAIVNEVSSEMLQSLQTGVESKIRNYENTVLARINKIHNVLPEPPKPEELATESDSRLGK